MIVQRSFRLRLMWIALVLFAIAQAVVLARAFGNRSGTPEARVVLTERELWRSSYGEKDEDTGLQTRLRWMERWRGETDPRSLGAGKLRALGFDVSVPPGDERAEWAYRRFHRRRAWVVLEMEGQAWREEIRHRRLEIEKSRAQAAAQGAQCQCDPKSEEEGLVRDLRSQSRLFAVDAGLDPEALRRSYPDRGRFLILPGTIGISVQTPYDQPKSPPAVLGSLSDLAVSELDVPLRLRPVFEEARRRHDREREAKGAAGEVWGQEEPGYRIAVAVGHRYEPWIAAAELLPEPKPAR